MMDMGPIVLQESIIAKIIWSLLGSLELEGSNASFMPLEGSKEATTNDRGLEAEECEAVEAGSEDNEVPRWQIKENKMQKYELYGGPTENVQFHCSYNYTKPSKSILL